MKHARSMIARLLIVTALLVLPAASQAQVLPSKALHSAEQFLATMDQQRWGQAYQDAGGMMRTLHDKEAWITEQSRDRQLLGASQQRQLTAVRFRDHYPGLPDGNYLIILYTTRTPVKKKAREVLVLKEGEGDFQVCKYSIR